MLEPAYSCDFGCPAKLFHAAYQMRIKGENFGYNLLMPSKWCSVSYQDVNGMGHSVTLRAESLYEAAALPVVAFRSSEMIKDDPVLGTELTVSVSPDIGSSHKVTSVNSSSGLSPAWKADRH